MVGLFIAEERVEDFLFVEVGLGDERAHEPERYFLLLVSEGEVFVGCCSLHSGESEMEVVGLGVREFSGEEFEEVFGCFDVEGEV